MQLAALLQESIIYSYDLATVPSILPAFANSRDHIICDEVCFISSDHTCDLYCKNIKDTCCCSEFLSVRGMRDS